MLYSHLNSIWYMWRGIKSISSPKKIILHPSVLKFLDPLLQVELKYFNYYNKIFTNHPLIQNSITSKKTFHDQNEKLHMKGEIILRTEKRRRSLPELQPLPRCVCQTISPPNTNTSLLEYQLPDRLSRHRNKPHKSWLKED